MLMAATNTFALPAKEKGGAEAALRAVGHTIGDLSAGANGSIVPESPRANK
jgi:hypothetical protein